MSLPAFLKQNGHDCLFIDMSLERNWREKIQAIRPEIIAYSITTGRHDFYQKLNVELKKDFSFFSIFGGPHTTFFPEFIEEEGVDSICRGEGENPLLELVETLNKKEDPRHIKNLWIKVDGEVFRNDMRPLVDDLDTLPFVDREILNKYQHYKQIHRRMVLTGRGCPYGCSYCFNHSYNRLYRGKGDVIRRRSIDHVMKELRMVREKYQPKRFQFIDDTFILDEDWCLEFSDRYKKEINLPFIAYTRVNLIRETIVKSLREAGCITMVYGIESGNDHIRNKVLKRNVSEKQILEAAKIYKKYHLRTYTTNMVAIPDETLEAAFETVRLNIKCKPGYAWCSVFQPFPGTDLWKYAIEKGYLEERKFGGELFYKASILELPHKRELENLRHLFSITVAFPFLFPIIKQLIKLPLGFLYYHLWNAHRAWCYFFEVKWIDFSELFIREK